MLAAAREMPPWRSRQLAAWLSDHRGLSVSASTVYRILRREGLVKRIEYQLAAGKEYQHKTTGLHQLWATDFVEFYNYRRYHQALRVVTPADVLEGRLEAILAQRKEVQRETFDRRRQYNQEVRETLKPGASSPQSLGPRTVQNR